MACFSVRGHAIPLSDTNPCQTVTKNGRLETTTRLVISDLPMHMPVAEVELLDRIGVDIRSKVMHDLARDEIGRISKFKTGRRFVYIVLPVVPLPKSAVYLHQNSTTKSNQKVWPVRPALNARKQVISPGIAQMNRFAVHVLVLCTKLGIPSAAWELLCQHQHQLIPAWAAWLMQPPPSPTSSLRRHQLGVTCLDGPACHPTPTHPVPD